MPCCFLPLWTWRPVLGCCGVCGRDGAQARSGRHRVLALSITLRRLSCQCQRLFNMVKFVPLSNARDSGVGASRRSKLERALAGEGAFFWRKCAGKGLTTVLHLLAYPFDVFGSSCILGCSFVGSERSIGGAGGCTTWRDDVQGDREFGGPRRGVARAVAQATETTLALRRILWFPPSTVMPPRCGTIVVR